MKKKAVKTPERSIVPFADIDVSTRYEDAYEIFRPDRLKSFIQEGYECFFTSENGIELRIHVQGDQLFRIRYKARGAWERAFSYALDPAYITAKPSGYEVEEFPDYIAITTAKLQCHVQKKCLKVDFLDSRGKKILKSRKGFQGYSTILKGMCDVSIDLKLDSKASYFGLGDKGGSLRLNGRRFENWNTDAYAYDVDTDPLYKTIPFTVGHRKGQWFGLFLDNTYRSYFDFGQTIPKSFQFGAHGGELNYYFFTGESSNAVSRTYASLTGKPELPAMWMLGFHQCRWSYYPESRLMEIAAEFRKRKIPCDALYLDIDYMDGYRCFTWDKAHFPDPKKMVQNLEEKGFKTVVMIDPGIKVDPDYPVYAEGLKLDYFCRRTNGDLMIGPVWPDNCAFPDFTREEVRDWWGKQYRELYERQGVHGFWNDMNEPAVFKINHKTFPDAVGHYYDGSPTDHRKAHNIYGQQMVRATQSGLKEIKPGKRPLVITRATYAGGQRFSFGWTGDNIASWEHLKLASTQCQRMSLSGFSLIGSDIGGFVDVPDAELMTRWVQLAVFHPFFRIHSMGNNVDGAAGAESELIKEQERINRLDQEPWSFGEKAEKHIRKAIELRYRLLPYLYTLCQKLATDGSPILRSLVLENPDEALYADWDEAFFVGDHLLVFPICEASITTLSLPLPSGDWYNYHNGQAVKTEAGLLLHPVKMGTIPIFVRAGALIPHYPLRQFTSEAPPDHLKLQAYFGTDKMESRVYEDQGDGYEYQKGKYLQRTFTQQGSNKSWSLLQSREGVFSEPYSEIHLELAGLPFAPKQVEIDGRSVEFKELDKRLVCRLSSAFKKLEIQ
ncbi:MAG: DUF4968 domain-containing protein [Saprospiraceae bacterium]|nr:DUF4968 domain-containing protein [Saprospiraceae bacterium]